MVELWHGRLGHMSPKGMEVLSRFGYLSWLKFSDLKHCEHCIYGKQTQCPQKKMLRQKGDKLDLVHIDVCQMPQLSLGGARYFATFIDDATRKVWAYPIKQKNDVFSVFQTFVALVENQTGKKLKCLRFDKIGRAHV